jgi:hypothetical protein
MSITFTFALCQNQTFELRCDLSSLSLVESATVYATQQSEYRVTTVLEPLLQTVLTKEEWQITKKAATLNNLPDLAYQAGDTTMNILSRDYLSG